MKCAVSLFTALTVGAVSTAGFAQLDYFNPRAAMQIAGEQVFAMRCAVCHAQEAGVHSIGPSLRGVVGRRAGSVAGFSYSAALKKSGLTWTEDNLRKWIADPSGTVAGTLMPHVSLRDSAEQLYVIAYLRSLKTEAMQ